MVGTSPSGPTSSPGRFSLALYVAPPPKPGKSAQGASLRLASQEKSGAKCAYHRTILIQTRNSCKHSISSTEQDQMQPRSYGFFPCLGTRLNQVTTSGQEPIKSCSGSLHLREFRFRNQGIFAYGIWNLGFQNPVKSSINPGSR